MIYVQAKITFFVRFGLDLILDSINFEVCFNSVQNHFGIVRTIKKECFNRIWKRTCNGLLGFQHNFYQKLNHCRTKIEKEQKVQSFRYTLFYVVHMLFSCIFLCEIIKKNGRFGWRQRLFKFL